MIIPTATSLKMKFPEFSEQTDASVELAIEEATRSVDDTWIVKDQTLGILYLAAHYLMVMISREESASGQQIRSETIGRMSISYATPNQPTEILSSDLTTTPYGIRFRELVELNNPPIAII